MSLWRQKRRNKRTLGLSSAPFLSAYHHNFKGYYEYTEESGNGKKTIKRVYAGIYYSPNLSKNCQTAYKILYWTIYLLSIGVIGFFSTRLVGGNTVWYVVTAQFGVGMGHVWLAIGLVNYVFAAEKRTKAEMKSTRDYILMASLFTAGCFALLTATMTLYCLLHQTFSLVYGACLLGHRRS